MVAGGCTKEALVLQASLARFSPPPSLTLIHVTSCTLRIPLKEPLNLVIALRIPLKEPLYLSIKAPDTETGLWGTCPEKVTASGVQSERAAPVLAGGCGGLGFRGLRFRV